MTAYRLGKKIVPVVIDAMPSMYRCPAPGVPLSGGDVSTLINPPFSPLDSSYILLSFVGHMSESHSPSFLLWFPASPQIDRFYKSYARNPKYQNPQSSIRHGGLQGMKSATFSPTRPHSIYFFLLGQSLQVLREPPPTSTCPPMNPKPVDSNPFSFDFSFYTVS
jgi:hypothetical protein